MSSSQARVRRTETKGKQIGSARGRGGTSGRFPHRSSRGDGEQEDRYHEDYNDYYEDDEDEQFPTPTSQNPSFRRVLNRRQREEIENTQYSTDSAAAAAQIEVNRNVEEEEEDEMDEEENGGMDANRSRPVSANGRKPRSTSPPNKTNKNTCHTSDEFQVWFTKTTLPPANEGQAPVVRAQCNFCEQSYVWKTGNGYGTLRRHLNKHKPKDAENEGTQTQQTQLNFTQGNNLSLFKYNEVSAREVMAKFVATESLAFQFADSMRFESSMKKAYNPQAKKISRSTMTRTIAKLSVRYKKALRDMFTKLPYRVSVCSDIWSCAWQQNSYLGMTVHWIDPNWCMNKRVLCFRKFNCAHSAANIALCIIKVLNQFRLTAKIFSIGFDNASANTASVPALIAACNPTLGGKYFHTRCICHIMNLCVQDGLKQLEGSITPIRKCVAMLRDKAKLHRNWLKFCKQKTGKSKSFNIDVCTRWNSTYEMLASTFEYKDLLSEFFSSEVSNMFLLSSYWDECSDLIALLKIFETATKDLSGVYYPTSCRVLYHCVVIALQFNICSSNPRLRDTITMMVMKWLKYFTSIPDVFLIAKCLDTSMKFDGVCGLLELYYSYLREMSFGVEGDFGENGFILPSLTTVKTSLDVSLRSLFKEYESKYSDLSLSRPSQRQRNSFNFGVDSSSEAAQRLQTFFQNQVSGSNLNSELDIYLSEPRSTDLTTAGPNDVDVLQWWSRRQNQYPILAMMAREILAVPASTVSVEQAFNVGGYVLDERRSVMTPRNLEAQVLLKDYTLAEMREQENNWNEIFAEYPISTTEAETDTDATTETDEFEDDWDFDADNM